MAKVKALFSRLYPMHTNQNNRDEILQREKAFHDHIFEKDYDENERQVVLKYYDTARASEEYFHTILSRVCQGKKALEYGCGPGGWTLTTLANGAAHVTGIDLSDTAIRKAKESASEHHAEELTEYYVMNAEDLTFPPKSFDVCYGNAILHHLDTEQAYQQIARILRPDGIAVFREPLGMNPLINIYRRMTPSLRTPDEHPFVMRDIALANNIFRNVAVEYFTFLPLALTPFRRWKVFPKMLSVAEGIDKILFKILPFTRRFAWMSVLVMSNPRV